MITCSQTGRTSPARPNRCSCSDPWFSQGLNSCHKKVLTGDCWSGGLLSSACARSCCCCRCFRVRGSVGARSTGTSAMIFASLICADTTRADCAKMAAEAPYPLALH